MQKTTSSQTLLLLKEKGLNSLSLRRRGIKGEVGSI